MAAEVEKRQNTHTRGNEIIAVVLTALAVLIFLSLVTYSPNDPSINTSSSHKTQNWVGVFGSNIADILFNTAGISAYFLPPLLALVAWRSFRAAELSLSIGRVAGYFLFVASFSSLAALFGFRGGILGVFFAQSLSSSLGGIGAGIMLAMFLAMSILMITNFSFNSFFGNFSLAWENFRLRFDEWFSKYRARRNEKREVSAQTQKRAEAKIEKTQPKTAPVSASENVASTNSEKNWLGEKASSIWTRFTKPEESKSIAEPEKIEKPKREIEEATVPTISVFQESPKKKEIEAETLNPFSEDENNEQITFTPVRETEELNAEISEESRKTDEKDEPEEIEIPLDLPKKPQNFDDYILPKAEFLNLPPPRVQIKEDEARALAKELEEKTREFNATGRVVNICPGPVVTTYEFKPDPGVKYSRITGLSDDLCLALKAESIRIDRIPGKAFVGIEVPNRERDTIYLREVVESTKFRESKSLLTIALGKTIDGLNYVADLAKMPHLLIAGATGAGKSVGVNTLVVSILYKAKPDEVKFIMVDPKRLELGLYADIPHLATPIITDPKRAAISLKWAVSEMEKRYKELAGWGVRNIDGFNAEVEKKNAGEIFDDNGEPHKKLPYIVIIIDELADLMMVSGKEVEESITRLAQMARAVGIHLVLATQRPSVDVITGLIKANFPARISFRVSSKVDSRTILDSNGSESLLGKGDMLFLPPASSQLIRVHGAFVDEKEISKIVEHIKAQGRPEYDATITKTEDELVDTGDLPGKKDALFVDALKTVVSSKRASTSLLQRHLRIGYGRAAAILDAMVHEGYIGDVDGSSRARPILQKAYDDLQELEEGREL
ncbi:MAG: DNA translocase FtsK 4TM domain-containing protein [Acidobacteriota bacterium]|nr:DNA translocase FtsK 4TM domain-containing protein [Acidobacteriota bacterium]